MLHNEAWTNKWTARQTAETHRQTNRQTDRQTGRDRQTDRQTDTQTDTQTEIQCYIMKDGQQMDRQAEVKKSEKYARERNVWGLPSNCIPLVFEHFGRWGSEAAQFLHRLSLQSIDEDGRKNSRDFKTFWRRCMSVALQRCNASVISRKLARLGHCKIFTVDSSFARS